MKIQVLSDLQTEINRLFIAGAQLAGGDPRLQNLLPVLSKMGERAPVFARLAQGTQALLAAGPDSSGERLLELGALLYAVLRTQGEASAPGETVPLPSPCGALPIAELRSFAKYSQLDPLLDALSGEKSARLEIVREAWREGLFADMRTHAAAVSALDSGYADLADLLEKDILPAVGAQALPYLRAQYDPEGEKSAGRRLRLLAKLGDPDAGRLALDALNAGNTSVALCAAAIDVLSDAPEHEALLFALCRDRKKPIREAAMLAVARFDSPAGNKLLLDAVMGKDYTSAVPPLAASRSVEVKRQVLECVRATERDCLAEGLPKEQRAERRARFAAVAGALAGVYHPAIVAYCRDALSSAKLRIVFGDDRQTYDALCHTLLVCLESMHTQDADEALRALARERETPRHVSEAVRYWFFAASRTYSKARMYDEFAPWYRKGLLERADFERVCRPEALDPRWVPEFLTRIDSRHDGAIDYGIVLADPANPAHTELLLKLLAADLRQAAKRKREIHFYAGGQLEKLHEAGLLEEARCVLMSCGKVGDSAHHAYVAHVLAHLSRLEGQ